MNEKLTPDDVPEVAQPLGEPADMASEPELSEPELSEPELSEPAPSEPALSEPALSRTAAAAANGGGVVNRWKRLGRGRWAVLGGLAVLTLGVIGTGAILFDRDHDGGHGRGDRHERDHHRGGGGGRDWHHGDDGDRDGRRSDNDGGRGDGSGSSSTVPATSVPTAGDQTTVVAPG